MTVLELMVVISVIGLLAALILPAVMYSRAAARRTQCANNLRNVGLALFSNAELHRRFPAAGYFRRDGAWFHSWVVSTLPGLDQQAIHEAWDFKTPLPDSPTNRRLADTHLAVLACPDDPTVTGQGDLSYVVNGGFGWTGPPCGVVTMRGSIDLNGNGNCTTNPADDGSPSDQDLMLRTGLFFVESWPPGQGTVRHHTPASITDGATQTIMLSENLHSGVVPNEFSNWAVPIAKRTCFFLSGYVCEGMTCVPGNVDYRRANERSDATFRTEALNTLDGEEGESPWPSSHHSGGVNVGFADGHVQFVSEQISGSVYASLLSPRGGDLKGALAQPLVTAGSY